MTVLNYETRRYDLVDLALLVQVTKDGLAPFGSTDFSNFSRCFYELFVGKPGGTSVQDQIGRYISLAIQCCRSNGQQVRCPWTDDRRRKPEFDNFALGIQSDQAGAKKHPPQFDRHLTPSLLGAVVAFVELSETPSLDGSVRTADIISALEKFGHPESSIKSALHVALIGKHLSSPSHGFYRKATATKTDGTPRKKTGPKPKPVLKKVADAR